MFIVVILPCFRWDATGAMAKITSPLLVLAGDMDIVTKPEAGQVIALRHPNGKYVDIDGVNHMGFLSCRQAITRRSPTLPCNRTRARRSSPRSAGAGTSTQDIALYLPTTKMEGRLKAPFAVFNGAHPAPRL